MQTLNAIGLIGFIVSVTIYIPFLMFLALCAWSALIEKIRTVIGVEQAVMDYMKNKAEFAEWKRNKAEMEAQAKAEFDAALAAERGGE